MHDVRHHADDIYISCILVIGSIGGNNVRIDLYFKYRTQNKPLVLTKTYIKNYLGSKTNRKNEM